MSLNEDPRPRAQTTREARSNVVAPGKNDAAARRRPANTVLLARAEPVAVDPTRLDCLRCQLIGRRRLLCSKVDACAEIPHSYAVGPMLLGAWFVTAIAFIVAVL